jgi:hypothetical protein
MQTGEPMHRWTVVQSQKYSDDLPDSRKALTSSLLSMLSLFPFFSPTIVAETNKNICSKVSHIDPVTGGDRKKAFLGPKTQKIVYSHFNLPLLQSEKHTYEGS